MSLPAFVWQRVQAYLADDIDEETTFKIQTLLSSNPQELVEAFQTDLDFGTGGLRAPVGIGTARFNLYTVRRLTQGLVLFLLSKQATPSVLIGYDCRPDSQNFAAAAAEVLIGNGIPVFMCEALRPTPLISFGCRFLKCSAGIMITASHNPPQDSGYKVYTSYGGQIAPPEDQELLSAMRKVTSLKQIKRGSLDSALFKTVGPELDEAYLTYAKTQSLNPELSKVHGAKLHIVYSNLHGTGGTLAPALLKRGSFTHLTQVASQETPDGTFPTVTSANPEDPKALALGINTLIDVKGDLLLAADPDADRLGVVVREHERIHHLTGSQVASLCLDFICSTSKQPNSYCIKTVVTSPLFAAIAKEHGIACIECLPGSKYIAQQIEELSHAAPELTCVLGAEESCGYFLAGAREKDGVLSSLIVAEASLKAHMEGVTLYQKLNELYRRHGIHRESVYTWRCKDAHMLMDHLRRAIPTVLGGRSVLSYRDYMTEPTSSDMLMFDLEGAWCALRPSGTEPKMKLYVGCVKPPCKNDRVLEQEIAYADAELKALTTAIYQQIKCP